MKCTTEIKLRWPARRPRGNGEAGFTLIESVVAMVVILVALLAVFLTMTYAINYNAGNNSRAKTLAVLQREIERLRSAKFTPCTTPLVTTGRIDPLLLGMEGTIRNIAPSAETDNLGFVITTDIDNDPSTTAVDDETEINSCNTAFKEIRLTARLASPSPGWQTAVPATLVLRRVRSN